jgi:hypothetical protein
VQLVPAASGITTDQVPLAHCWYEVPPTQLNIPSDVHAVPAVTAVPEPLVPVLAAGAADVADGVAPEAAAVEATWAETTEAVVVPAAGAVVGTVWKTPPEAAGAVVAAGEAVVATGEAVEATAGVA